MNPPVLNAAHSFPSVGTMFHPSLGQVRYSIREITGGEDPNGQVADTVSLMKEYCREDLSDPTLQQDVQQAWRSSDPLTDTWNYLHRDGDRGMRFVRDEETYEPFAGYESAVPGRWRPFVESLARPEMLAKLPDPHGDCDDFCSYGATHLLLRGVPCSFATVAADAVDPSIYSHVYLVAYPQNGPYAGRRVPLDLSHGKFPGWEVQKVFARKEWPLVGTGRGLCLGIGLLGLGALIYSAKRREGLFA